MFATLVCTATLGLLLCDDDSSRSSRHEEIQELRDSYEYSPAAPVPEPTAPVLFASGCLLVASALRNQR